MLNEETYKKILKFILFIYPIFSLEIFYNSYFTLIQIVLIFFLFINLLVTNKDSHKKVKYIILYYIILVIYGIFHHLNALHFTSLVPGNFNYNWLSEALQLFKLSTPLVFIYTLYYSKLTLKDYLNILKIWLIFICGSIIITNLFNISLSSYTANTIKGNIFSWFFNNYFYQETASRGFFMYANQISCLLVVLIPLVNCYYLSKKITCKYIIILLLALLMLGTRISNLASIMVFFTTLIIYLFLTKIAHQKINKQGIITCVTLGLIYLVILPFSPTVNRYNTYDYLLDNHSILAYVNQEDINYIKDNYQAKEINEEFILYRYPYEYDSDFWLKILNEPIEKRADYRYLEISMIKRVVEINNNKMDIFFGITNDRVQNIFNIERDYILQYYAFGLIGSVIILSIYFLIFIKNIHILLKKFTYENTSYVISTSLLLIIAYLSGNIYNCLPIIIPLLFITFFNAKKLANV